MDVEMRIKPNMSNLLYVSRSKASMVTVTKKNLSLIKRAFKRGLLNCKA